MEMKGNIPVWGTHEDKTLRQIETCARTADRAALMADGHLGYAVPIGGVVAYKDAISPSGVGYDIACGNKAVRVDMPGAELRSRIGKIMDDVWSTISFGVGRRNPEPIEQPAMLQADYSGWDLEATFPLRHKANAQLGTVGSGNHYVDLFTDERDRVWIGVHFGSRGFGHGIATWFLDKAGASEGMEVEPCVIGATTDLGEQYIRAMTLAGEYAYAGRDWVCDRVAKILGAPILESVHNHHNFAWREEHNGEQYWVVRKGATPAFPGQKGFVGGTMAEPAVILEGVDSEESKLSMYSTVHGAGRVMGRREATGIFHKKSGEMKRAPKITQAMMQQKVRQANVELRGAGVDESPHCYKRLNEVLAHHMSEASPTVRILHTLTPVGVAMAGANEWDPYKD